MARKKLATVVELRRPDPAAAEMRRVMREAGASQAELAAEADCGVRTVRRHWRGEGLDSLRRYLRWREMAEKRRAA